METKIKRFLQRFAIYSSVFIAGILIALQINEALARCIWIPLVEIEGKVIGGYFDCEGEDPSPGNPSDNDVSFPDIPNDATISHSNKPTKTPSDGEVVPFFDDLVLGGTYNGNDKITCNFNNNSECIYTEKKKGKPVQPNSSGMNLITQGTVMVRNDHNDHNDGLAIAAQGNNMGVFAIGEDSAGVFGFGLIEGVVGVTLKDFKIGILGYYDEINEHGYSLWGAGDAKISGNLTVGKSTINSPDGTLNLNTTSGVNITGGGITADSMGKFYNKVFYTDGAGFCKPDDNLVACGMGWETAGETYPVIPYTNSDTGEEGCKNNTDKRLNFYIYCFDPRGDYSPY